MVRIIKKIDDEGFYNVTTPFPNDRPPFRLPSVLGNSMEYIFYSVYGDSFDSLNNVDKWYLPLKSLQQFLNTLHSSYSSYSYLPIYLDSDNIDDSTYYMYIINKLKQHLFKYLPTFRKTLLLINQSIEATRILKIDTKKDGSNKDTKTYGNKIEGSSDTDSMNENSPINATLGDIVTPNNKNKATFGSTTEKTGTDTIDYTIDESIDDTHTETSPEYFKEIMKIYEKYNIYDIIHMCYRKVINEFNTSL